MPTTPGSRSSRTSTPLADTIATAGRSPEGGRPVTARERRRYALSRLDLKLSPYLYIAPFFIIFAVVGLFPLLYTGYISVLKWDPIEQSGKFVGLDNYAFIFSDVHFWNALRNTFSIFLLSSIPQIVCALVIAGVLDQNLKGKTFWRMAVLLPYVMMPVAIGVIFSHLYADQTGVMNHLLTSIGLPAVPWHTDTFAAQVAIATMVNFRWTGYNTLILLAGMQAIPRDLYEQASIDGAGRIRQFFSITIPQLRPTLIFVIITSTIGGLQIFDETQMYNPGTNQLGGSDDQYLTLTGYLFNLGWRQVGHISRAAAVGWVLFLIIVILAIVNFVISSRIATNDSRHAARAAKQARKAVKA